MKNKSLIFKITRTAEHEFIHDSLWIGEYSITNTQKMLEGTIGNKDGYVSPEAAVHMNKTYQALLDDGHTYFYDWSTFCHSFSINYQVNKNPDGPCPEYCTPIFQWPSNVGGCRWAMKFIQRLGTRIEKSNANRRWKASGYQILASPVGDDTFGQLQDVVEALKIIAVAEVEIWIAPDGTTLYVPATIATSPTVLNSECQ